MLRTTPSRKPDLILCSDFHLREDTPTCYTGDYQQEQWDSVDFVSNLQEQYDCPVFHAGDLFDKWKPSPWLLRKTILHLPKRFYTVYGQHDLPQHSLDQVDKCGINVLEAGHHLTVLAGVHWGQFPSRVDNMIIGKIKEHIQRKILTWHHLTYMQKPFPGASVGMVQMILQKYPQYDLILTGDNHQSFTTTFEGRVLVNPGSLMRMDADQINFKPSVYLWYADTNTVQRVFIPIKEGVISREHIIVKEERDARIDAFVTRLDGDWEVSMSLDDNFKHFFSKNLVRQEVKQIVYNSLE